MYIALALVLAAITFLVVPVESLDSTGEVIAGLSYPGRAIVAIAIFMATLWVTGALPVAVTALMPLVLFPLCTGGAISVKTAAAPYAHELVFLFICMYYCVLIVSSPRPSSCAHGISVAEGVMPASAIPKYTNPHMSGIKFC